MREGMKLAALDFGEGTDEILHPPTARFERATLPREEHAMQDPIALGLAVAFRGCETWIFDAASWVNGTASFLEVMNRSDQVSEVSSISDYIKPPMSL